MDPTSAKRWFRNMHEVVEKAGTTTSTIPLTFIQSHRVSIAIRRARQTLNKQWRQNVLTGQSVLPPSDRIEFN